MCARILWLRPPSGNPLNTMSRYTWSPVCSARNAIPVFVDAGIAMVCEFPALSVIVNWYSTPAFGVKKKLPTCGLNDWIDNNFLAGSFFSDTDPVQLAGKL